MMNMRTAHGRVVLVLVVLVVSALVLTGCSSVTNLTNPKGTLSGTVQPAAARATAQVTVMPGGTPTAVNADGTFQIKMAPGTGFTIQVTATGFLTYDSALLTPPLSYNVAALTATPVGTITLVAGP